VNRNLTRSLHRPSGQGGITLIELLIALTILSVLSVMILTAWFSLQRSYAFSTRSSMQQEMARDAMSRMVREIRDSGGQAGSAAGSGILVAKPQEISMRTAFNDAGVAEVRTDGLGDGYPYVPPQGGYYYDSASGTLYRWRDTDEYAGKSSGDRVDAVVKYVVNGTTPIFRYTCINTGESTAVAIGEPYQTTSPTDRTSIVSVQIMLRVDLNPGKSPQNMELISTAQPRNHRQT
jgi:prepilin-type N-terminal cleavage/methylation domain-containing protein